MTREEEIEEFAKTYDCCYVDNNYYAIKVGIEWADEHPSDEIQRQSLFRRLYRFTP